MKYPFLLMAMPALFSCGGKQPASASIVSKERTDTTVKQYFPVVGFIRGEISAVDSLPVGIKKYLGDNKNRYVYIKPEEFHRLAAEFIPNELSDSLFAKQYQETSFMDQSNNTGTFLYTTKNASLPVQRVDVLTAKGDVYDKVKSIYLQKNYRSGDTAFTKKLTWNPQRNFQIITQAEPGSGNPVTTVVNIVWDNGEAE